MTIEDECCWSDLVSKRIYERYGSNIQIPSDIASDIVEVFDKADVTKGIFRFVIYIYIVVRETNRIIWNLYVREVRSTIWEAGYPDDDILEKYHDPVNPGSYGEVTRFAKENGMSTARARKILQKDLGYTLHKPCRLKFPTLPVVVFGIDQQWTVDLIKVNNIAKYNRGYRYLLTVVDVFSKRVGGTRQGQDRTSCDRSI